MKTSKGDFIIRVLVVARIYIFDYILECSRAGGLDEVREIMTKAFNYVHEHAHLDKEKKEFIRKGLKRDSAFWKKAHASDSYSEYFFRWFRGATGGNDQWQTGGQKAETSQDLYKILGVKRGASDKEITRAYRKHARKHHPDRNPGNKQAKGKMQEINEAYRILGNSSKRKAYDEAYPDADKNNE